MYFGADIHVAEFRRVGAVHTVAEEDVSEVVLGIYPDAGAGESGMTVSER